LTDDRFEYLRYDLEWHQFLPLPLLPDTRRLAIKTRLQKAEALSGKEVPFFDYPKLGSAIDLRGFRTDRFRDDGSLLVTVEYRYPLWDFADMVLFLDEGQVFSRFEDIALDKFKTGFGFGFHLISTSGFAFRSEFAFSRESSRVILSINPNF
jgi:outer membrane protein assembly factor BamA